MHVIVIGAGIIGASIADALAGRGASVAVLDMRTPGRGASQASAGMLAPYTEAHGDERLLALGRRSLDLFDAFIDGLNAVAPVAVEYARRGTLEVALDDHRAGELVAARRELEARGVGAKWLEGAALRAEEPALTPRAVAGLLTPAHGHVGVSGLIAALLYRARRRGAVVETPAEGVAVEDRGPSVDVRIGPRTETADFVVVAGGSWSGRVRVRHVPSLPVRPVRGQLLHLGWATPPALSRIVWGTRAYLVPWSDGSLLVGATMEDVGFDERATAEGIRDLTSAAIELLPGAAGATFHAVRVGLRPALPDGLPAIGPYRSAPRVVAATGHFRNGILLAPVTAEMVARYVLDGVADSAFEATGPDRFATAGDGGRVPQCLS